MTDKERLDWMEEHLLHLGSMKANHTVLMGGEQFRATFQDCKKPGRQRTLYGKTLRELIDEAHEITNR